MEFRSKIYLVILSFLPILLYPVSVEFSLLIALALAVFGMEVLKDKQTVKQMLRPLLVLIGAATILLGFNFLVSIINGFGDLSNVYLWGGFRRFLFDFMDIIRTLLFIFMIVTSVFIGLSYKTQKPVPVLDKVIENFMTGTCPFKKASKKEKQKKEAEPKQVELIETEVAQEEQKPEEKKE